MNYFCGVVLAVSLFMVVSTEPLDLGDRVWTALEEKGIGREKLAQMVAAEEKDNVGDIWTNCGTSSGDIGTINRLTIEPDPPRKGENLNLEADVTLSERVINGTIKLKLQYYILGIPVTDIDQTFDLCGPETKLTCPLNAGKQNMKYSEVIPLSTNGDKYTGYAVATSGNGKQIACIDLKFNM